MGLSSSKITSLQIEFMIGSYIMSFEMEWGYGDHKDRKQKFA